ncbi:transglycosylase domain-containing protein [Streptomyces orinoci]|uniref:Transglycosylase domain-containing protein n=1 Tax=Streptomyces orinoci TaxID=67339 RepID=A0ABV3JSG0_STRON|nr:transglycosylase domain-containing protein [Streptomyces orinoci]
MDIRRRKPRHRRRAAERPEWRFIDYPRQGRRGFRRWLPSWRLLLGSVTLGLGALAGLFAYVYVSVDIPDENVAARQEANTYYWSDGSQMVSVGPVNRNVVQLADVPKSARNAVIAAENASFYTDAGVSFKGLLRAVVSMAEGKETQGGSTITQQYVKNTYLSQEQTATRKIKEFVISLKLDQRKSKDEILQGYLNTSWFGRGAYGIEAAAQAYYGIPARKLDPGQSALLAALLKGAEQYDPSVGAKNHQRAEERWKWILDRQVKVGLMSPSERDNYRTFPEPHKQSNSTSVGGQIGYLVDVANKYIKQRTDLTDKELAHGGYRVHTTFDKQRTEQLRQAVEGELKRDLDPKKRSASDSDVQAGAASVRPSDGAVLAVYGGPDATKHFADNADTSGVPVGSAFKPFVLAAALQYGAGGRPVVPDSYFDAAGTLRSEGGGSDDEHPSLRQALLSGGNATFVRLGREVGLQRVRDTAVRSGLLPESMAPLETTFPIGTSTPSAVRMAGAYGTFANQGLTQSPYSVTRLAKDGVTLDGFRRGPASRALDEQVAAQVTEVLRESGGKAGVGPAAAGRTGEQDRFRSAWFVGFDRDLSTAVTLFRTKPDEPQLLPMADLGGQKGRYGNDLTPKIWRDYMAAVGR